MIKRVLRKLYRIFKKDNTYLCLGIKSSEIKRLRKTSGPTKTTLFGKIINTTETFWYIHGLNEIFLDGVYEFKTQTMTPYILDCGANIGLSAIYFKQQYPKANIIAFEPDKMIVDVLQQNLSAFHYDDVEIVPKAIWSENTTLKFKSDGSVGGQLVNEKTLDKTIEVETTRLKDYLNKQVDFLKIDIEGAEYDVLVDCRDSLINVENIFIEYHSFLNKEQKLDEILLILKNAGFKYYIKEAWDNMPRPYVDNRSSHYDLQLNIFGYRL